MLRMALAIPGAIGSEVFITYIGLGLPLSIPSLGNLITVGRKFVSTPQSYQLIFHHCAVHCDDIVLHHRQFLRRRG